MNKKKIIITYSVLGALCVGAVFAGIFLFSENMISFICGSLVTLLLAALLFAFEFRRDGFSAQRICLIAVMTAISVLGRILFYPIAFFKPVSAVVIICGMYLGSGAGFLCGALSAFVSNFFFVQGPWTPYQMLAWGLIGLFAGLLSRPLKKSRMLLSAYGIVAGVFFSAVMDIWMVMQYEGGMSLPVYIAAFAQSLPVTAVYAVSNVVFLLALCLLLGRKLDRITLKYP